MSNNMQNNLFQVNNVPPPPPVFQVQQGPGSYTQQVQMPGVNLIPQQVSNSNITQQPIQQFNQLFGGPQQVAQQVHGGFYGRRPQQGPNQAKQPDVFNDDEAIVEKVKEEKKDAKIEISIKAQRSMAKLKEEVMLPAMVSLKTEGGSRTSVDLICVIDVSGSMSG